MSVPTLVGQPVTLENCWTFIRHQPEIFEEFIYFFLKQLLQAHLDLTPNSEEVEDYLNQFSEVSQLTSAEQFEHWLEANDDDYDSFMERMRLTISMKNFCHRIDGDKDIKAKFKIRKHQFDYIVLSRLIFTDSTEAHRVCNEIKAQPRSFPKIFQTYILSNQVKLTGWKEAFIRADLPEEIQSLPLPQFSSSASHLFNHFIDQPLKVRQGWCLIYIHHFIPVC